MRLFLRIKRRIHEKYQFGNSRPRVTFLFYFCLFDMEWPCLLYNNAWKICEAVVFGFFVFYFPHMKHGKFGFTCKKYIFFYLFSRFRTFYTSVVPIVIPCAIDDTFLTDFWLLNTIPLEFWQKNPRWRRH
jgi:hypothetical protein